ncbi:MAG: hypothetical protein RTU30_14225, partial [Candidatus Thorarchaeota archaeon]
DTTESTPHSLLIEGNELEKKGRNEEALLAYHRATEANPKFTRGWYHKFLILLKLDRSEEALECAQQIVTQEPSWIAFVKKKIPDFEYTPREVPPQIEETPPIPEPESVSEEKVDSADSVDTILVDYDSMMAKIIHGEGKAPDPLKDWLKDSPEPELVVEKTPLDVVEDVFANYQDGVEIEAELLQKIPFWINIREYLHAEPESISESVLKEGVKSAEKKTKENKSDIESWMRLASCYFYLKDIKNSEGVLKAAILHCTESAELWFMLGALLWPLDRPEESMEALEKAHSIDPQNKLVGKYYGYIGLKVKFGV